MRHRNASLLVAGLTLLLAAAPSFAGTAPEATDQHGQSHRWLAPFEGVTIVDFAASWCGPCRHSLPRLEEFAAEHPELRVLVVSVDRTAKQRDHLVDSLNLNLPVLWDEGHAIAEHYRPPTMPASFLVGPDGLILHVSPGSSDDEWQELKQRIAEVAAPGSARARPAER